MTGALGALGILSTYLLARTQRVSDRDRLKTERRDRYRFAEHEKRAELYGDYIAELRSLRIAMHMRVSVTGAYFRKLGAGFAETVREEVGTVADDDPDLRDTYMAIAKMLDADASLGPRIARRTTAGMPPAVDTVSAIARITQLSARIRIVGGADMVRAADTAEGVAIAALIRVAALEAEDLQGTLDLEPLAGAIHALEEASVYELRLLPYGERRPLGDLRAEAEPGKNPAGVRGSRGA